MTAALGEDGLTLATLASVPASVTTVGVITLCTDRLNIGWIRFALSVDDVAVVILVATVLVELFRLPRRLRGAAGPLKTEMSSLSECEGDSDRCGCISTDELSDTPPFGSPSTAVVGVGGTLILLIVENMLGERVAVESPRSRLPGGALKTS